MDLFAAEIGKDPAEVRRINLVPADRFPFTSAAGATYDTGAYVEALDKVLEGAGYAELRAEQARRRERGDVLQLGVGVASYVEITAADADGGETARLVVHDDGTVTVYTGSSAHGQGHHTAWAMLVEAELGIDMSKVTVVHGDTDPIPAGVGTYASRSCSSAAWPCRRQPWRSRSRRASSPRTCSKQSATDLELDVDRGVWQVRGDPASSRSWAEVASHAGEAGLTADVNYTEGAPTFPFGTHLAVTEVDTETGKARLIRHVTVDDAGTILSPVLAEGQRHGGIAQGVAQALLEEVVYDADGNPVTGTLVDYAIVTAAELPSFELLISETPATINPLGAKGIGEAGTIGATPATQNSVIDAVSHLGIRHIDMPLTPARVWAAISAAQSPAAQNAATQNTAARGTGSGQVRGRKRQVKVTVKVNGSEVAAEVADRTLLVHFVRDVVSLTAVTSAVTRVHVVRARSCSTGDQVKSCTVRPRDRQARRRDGRGPERWRWQIAQVQRAFRAGTRASVRSSAPGVVMATRVAAVGEPGSK
jgi:carbon-monoxide dehydrogenase large subunit